MEDLSFRTDMADERVDEYRRVHNLSKIDGIKIKTRKNKNIKTTTVDVLNEKGKSAVGKDIGRYITMEIQNIEYIEEEEKQIIISEIANNLKELIPESINSIMVVGLGNAAVTPDSLGPKVTSYVNVTRHIIKYAKDIIKPGTREISSISPGVMGTTGIETEEIIESTAKFVKPELLIVIDSLASSSIKRLGKTIQIGNTGITPGAGVGNTRHSINKESLGIDVIAIGVPLVVDLATITNDAIDLISNDTNLNIKSNSKEERYKQISISLNADNLIVTPKEIDEVVFKISEIIASAINIAI